MSLIGQSVKRLEDRPLLTGSGRFVADNTPPGALCLRVVRSPVAFGRLTIMRISEALAHPGTVAVWTAQDVADIPPIGFRMPPAPGLEAYRQPILADGHVRYVGEPIAAVFAIDPYSAEDIAELVASEIEPLAPCVDLVALPREFAPGVSTEVAVITKAYGDLEAAFAGAHAVVSLELTVGRHSGVPLETRGAIAVPEAESGILRFYGAAKVPHYNRQALAAAAARSDPSARRACLGRLRHSGRALSGRCSDLRGSAAARKGSQVDRGPLRASGGGKPVARVGPSGARGGRRGRLYSGS